MTEQMASRGDDAGRELRVLRTFLASLPPVERALLLLYLEDLSYRQISEVLGMGESLSPACFFS